MRNQEFFEPLHEVLHFSAVVDKRDAEGTLMRPSRFTRIISHSRVGLNASISAHIWEAITIDFGKFQTAAIVQLLGG